ncbi:expressed protein [Dictyostelium purpureum]|uniref:Expressed protein n=1 Tax=Dictyostelium purpureum TaxID=5786 RepID=F0ZHL5_DICPU|nr:uncharacterized protein DICPUDRAFT_97541 [Dictyostelium purpureum]EGC36535.1 expressed protein [Dictyostelium purpureum]|eukprot:XP_003286907.1 expressed protein [Dictyostelium purpureum]
MNCNNKRKNGDTTNNNTDNTNSNNNNDNSISNKKYKSTDGSEFDNTNTSTNTPSLVFTSNKENDSTNEIRFWKVFRNKYLFNIIFSNFKFNQLFNYDDLNDCHHIYNKFSNGETIIRDKVKSGNYIIRDFNAEFIVSVFTKNTQENREFYRTLFSNGLGTFRNYFIWVQAFVNHSNKTAFLEYLKNFKIDKTSFFVRSMKSSKSIFKQVKMEDALKSNGFHFFKPKSVFDVIREFQFSQKLKKLINIYIYCIHENYQPKTKHNYLLEQLNTQLITILSDNIHLNSTIHTIAQSKDKFLIQTTYLTLKIIYSIFAERCQSSLTKPTSYHIYFRDKSKAEKIYAKRIESLNLSDEPLTVIKSDECIEFQMSLVKSLHTISRKTKVEQAIFSSNNLEPIYLMFKLYKDDLYGNFFRYLRFITKTEILDYIFDNHQELMFSDNNPLWIYTNSKVMGHFENLMKSISRKFLIKSNLTITDLENTPSKDFFEGLERAVDNPTVYIFEDNKNYPQNSINRYNSYFIKLTNLTQDSAISLLEKHIKKYGISEYFDIENFLKNELHQSYKLIYWIFQDLTDEYIQSNLTKKELIIKSGINTTKNQKYEIKIKRFISWEMLLYYCGRTNILFQNFNSQLKEEIFTDLLEKKFKVGVFLNLLDHLSYSDFNSENFKNLLNRAADFGVVRVFEKFSIFNYMFFYEIKYNQYNYIDYPPNPRVQSFLNDSSFKQNFSLNDKRYCCLIRYSNKVKTNYY